MRPRFLLLLALCAVPTSHAPCEQTGTVTLERVELDDADLRDALELLATQAHRNIVCGDEVRGTATATLRDMPFERALDALLEPHGYTWERHRDGTYVVSAPSTPLPVKATNTPEQVVREYLDAWAKGDYGAMYALTTEAGRKQIARQEFELLVERETAKALGAPGSLKLVSVYPPTISGRRAEVGFTVAAMDPKTGKPRSTPRPDGQSASGLTRLRAYVALDGDTWRLPMAFDENSSTWRLPPSYDPSETSHPVGQVVLNESGRPAETGLDGTPKVYEVIALTHLSASEVVSLFAAPPLAGWNQAEVGGFGPSKGFVGGFGGGRLGGGGFTPPGRRPPLADNGRSSSDDRAEPPRANAGGTSDSTRPVADLQKQLPPQHPLYLPLGVDSLTPLPDRNAVLATGTRTSVAVLKEILSTVDVPTPRARVEARVVTMPARLLQDFLGAGTRDERTPVAEPGNQPAGQMKWERVELKFANAAEIVARLRGAELPKGIAEVGAYRPLNSVIVRGEDAAVAELGERLRKLDQRAKDSGADEQPQPTDAPAGEADGSVQCLVVQGAWHWLGELIAAGEAKVLSAPAIAVTGGAESTKILSVSQTGAGVGGGTTRAPAVDVQARAVAGGSVELVCDLHGAAWARTNDIQGYTVAYNSRETQTLGPGGELLITGWQGNTAGRTQPVDGGDTDALPSGPAGVILLRVKPELTDP